RCTPEGGGRRSLAWQRFGHVRREGRVTPIVSMATIDRGARGGRATWSGPGTEGGRPAPPASASPRSLAHLLPESLSQALAPRVLSHPVRTAGKGRASSPRPEPPPRPGRCPARRSAFFLPGSVDAAEWLHQWWKA